MIFPETAVICYALSTQQAQDEAEQYGVTGARLDRLYIITPTNNATAIFALAASKPWFRLTEKPSANHTRALTRFGQPITAAAAFAIINDEYAVNPKAYRSQGTPG